MHSNIDIPQEYLQHIEKQLPNTLSLADFISSCQQPLRLSIRVNTLKISVDDFKVRAKEKGWALLPIPWCDTGFWLNETKPSECSLGNSAEHLAGLFYIQEASSMLPVTALFSELDDKDIQVLDMAAAPGSKTTQIAALLDNNGLVVANEYSASRVKILHANQVRTGASHCALTHYDARVFGDWLPESFDAILLEAPCSGEGTIRKDAKAFSNWTYDSICDIANTQKALIVSAFKALKVGGTMVYSTCTLSQEENQQVCLYLQALYGEAVAFEPLTTLFPDAKKAITPEGFLHVFPQIYDSEGFFVAKIQKKAAVPCQMIAKKPRKFPFSPVLAKEQQNIVKALAQSYDMSIPSNLTLWVREQELWLFPAAVIALLDEIKFDRIGLKLAQIHKQGYKWQHEAILALCGQQNKSIKKITLNAKEANAWYKGQDVRPEISPSKGEVVVYYRDHPIGIGKWVGNKIKNALPRDLVRNAELFAN